MRSTAAVSDMPRYHVDSPTRARQTSPQRRPGHGVQVVVRVRPMLPRELQFDSAVEVLSVGADIQAGCTCEGKEVVVFKPDAEFASVYDCVLGVHSTQQELYQLVQGSILSSLDGYNSTVFAYGQTGTGKTHSMMGPPDLDLTSAMTAAADQSGWDKLGIIPRALSDLFQKVQERSARDGVRIAVAASYLEIYNDRLYDLLQPYKKGLGGRDPADMMQNKALHEVREDKQGNTFVPNALCVKVTGLKGVLTLLNKGQRHRAVRHTEMNMVSSRSHAILQLVVEQYPQGQGAGAQASRGTVLRSKLNFVDLAGNERWNKEVDMGSERVGELTAINGSLSALGTVVAALTEGGGRRHVPYRDSKLTHLLQDSLGGNCRTTIIATVSPSVSAFDETVSTLKFADRASAIGNNPVVNTSRDMSSVLALKEREIMRLRQLLAEYMEGVRGTGEGTPPPATTDSSGAPGDSPLRTHTAGSQMTAEQLMQELENTRQALEMERQLRTELEAQLRQTTALDGSTRTPTAAPALSTPEAQSPLSPGTTRRIGPQVDYLQITTPLDSSSECLSPDAQGATTSGTGRGQGPATPQDPSSSWQPFKAVLSRRAELGLTGTPTPGPSHTSHTSTSPLRYSSSPPRRSTSALPSRQSQPQPWHTPSGQRGYSPKASAGPARDHQGAMEAAMRSLKEQVAQLAALEQQNRQRMAASLAASRAARVSASPLRQQRRIPEVSVYRSVAGSGGLRSGTRHTAATADSFDQLVEAAHDSVKQSQQEVTPITLYPPPAATSGGGGSWGRSAILKATPPHTAWPGSGDPGQGTSSSSGWSAPATSSLTGGTGAGLGAGWGRSSLLSGVPQQAPLSAPPTSSTSGMWGRSMLQPPQQVSTPSPTHNTSAPRTGPRLDKGSMIYVLGPSTSSIRAKSLANAWG